MRENWDKSYGDRRQEIVFIGLSSEMLKVLIFKQLNDCLEKDYITVPKKHEELEDPFPAWFQKQQ